MDAKHTPIPWDVQNKGNPRERSARHEIVSDKVIICKMPNLSKQSYENAEFIVRAVNSHNELLEALEGLLMGIDIHEQYDIYSCDYCGREYFADVSEETGDIGEVPKFCTSDDCRGYIARAAIQKAKG